MLELERIVRHRATWEEPEDSIDIITTGDFEMIIDVVIADNDLTLEDAKEELLKFFVPYNGDINQIGWCNVEINGKVLELSQIWDMSLFDLVGQTIKFLKTEN